MTTYSEKLRDPRWQKKRLEILNRDEWTCKHCFNTKETLHVHHMCYPKDQEPWDVDHLALITVCESCHNLLHNGTEQEKLETFLRLWFVLWLKDAKEKKDYEIQLNEKL